MGSRFASWTYLGRGSSTAGTRRPMLLGSRRTVTLVDLETGEIRAGRARGLHHSSTPSECRMAERGENGQGSSATGSKRSCPMPRPATGCSGSCGYCLSGETEASSVVVWLVGDTATGKSTFVQDDDAQHPRARRTWSPSEPDLFKAEHFSRARQREGIRAGRRRSRPTTASPSVEWQETWQLDEAFFCQRHRLRSEVSVRRGARRSRSPYRPAVQAVLRRATTAPRRAGSPRRSSCRRIVPHDRSTSATRTATDVDLMAKLTTEDETGGSLAAAGVVRRGMGEVSSGKRDWTSPSRAPARRCFVRSA